MKHLVIVESPTKAKTIARFLPKDFSVESSFGHIRDLPKSSMGIDIEHDFEPKYVIPKLKQKKVTELKKKAQAAETVYFATDHDREGEAISWHLAQIFAIDPRTAQRITFDEITKKAVLNALEHARGIDLALVDAQQGRRVLDRLVGYELSPFLWKKILKGLSAGRVQSVAVRLVVEREREIKDFIREEYWTIDADFKRLAPHEGNFTARLAKIDGKTLDKLAIKTKDECDAITSRIQAAQSYSIESIEQKEKQKTPPPPFTTSTLQQAANNKLSFSAKRTMVLAQQLYEGVDIPGEGAVGFITYMRTDSVTLSDEFLASAHDFIHEKYGDSYGVQQPRRYKTKSKSAQEAHEAIRPTDIRRTPEMIKEHLEPATFRLYKIIWQRACASQMAEALIDQTTVLVNDKEKKYTFKATGSIVRFDGYLKVSPIHLEEKILPALEPKEPLDMASLLPEQHFTEPPARYTEASLVKALEEHGIGRPSTYAPTLATIQERSYVAKEEKQLKPTDIAFIVNDLLVEHFPEIVDYQFTAQMEEKLDDVAEGKLGWRPMIAEFYGKFKENLTNKYAEISKKDLMETETSEVCDKCGGKMVIRMGRFGKFLACGSFPECKNTKKLPVEGGENDAETSAEGMSDETCPKCNAQLTKKQGRYGTFLGCSRFPECKYIKKQETSTGVACPQCNTGTIITKRSKRGKIFYSCNRYPECKYALWDKPTGAKCEKCGSQMVEKKQEIVCSNKECGTK